MEVVRLRRAVHIAQAERTIQPADTEGLAATMQAGHIAEIVAVTGEAVTGIRTMDILGLGITAWAITIHTTGIIRGGTILTATDTGLT
jgi:hypothetical protein